MALAVSSDWKQKKIAIARRPHRWGKQGERGKRRRVNMQQVALVGPFSGPIFPFCLASNSGNPIRRLAATSGSSVRSCVWDWGAMSVQVSESGGGREGRELSERARARVKRRHRAERRCQCHTPSPSAARGDRLPSEQSQSLGASGASETGAIFIVCEHTTKKLITAGRARPTSATTTATTTTRRRSSTPIRNPEVR